jgi:RNA polymerase sigma-70 factor (ECF subfamily)
MGAGTEARSPSAVIEALCAAMNGTAPAEAGLTEQVDALFAMHQPRVYRLCLRMVGDPERARDLAQDTMLTAYRKLPEFRGDAQFGTWLYGIAKHLCLNAIRRRGEVLSEDGVIEVDDATHSALRQLRQQEREALVTAAAQAVLDPLEQEAVYLRYVEGMPQDRITEVLGLDDKSGARGLLQRCRRKLQRELRERLALLGHGSSFVRGTML